MRYARQKNKAKARSNITKPKAKRKNKRRCSYRGFYKGIRCDSRWELAFLICCLDKGRKIVRCPYIFTYTVNGKQHRYFPDFLLGSIVVEIKGKWKKNLHYKLQAVVEAGFKVKLIDEKRIKPYLKYCYKKFKTEQIQKLYDKK